MQLEGSPHSQTSAAGASLQMTQIQHNENSYLMVQKEQMQLNRSERYSSPICLLLLLTMRCAVVQAMFDRYCQPQASVISHMRLPLQTFTPTAPDDRAGGPRPGGVQRVHLRLRPGTRRPDTTRAHCSATHARHAPQPSHPRNTPARAAPPPRRAPARPAPSSDIPWPPRRRHRQCSRRDV